jgi:predicted RNA-binding protein with PIN domain
MSVLIDGHNLVAQLDDLSLSDPDDEARLVQRLKVYRSAINRPITVVFDHGERYTPPQDLSGGGVKVLFAALDSSADELIVQRITRSREPHALLVVSTDGEVQAAARSRGAQVMTAQEFARQMKETHAPRHKRRRRKPVFEPAVSAAEVEYWVRQFESRKGERKRSGA